MQTRNIVAMANKFAEIQITQPTPRYTIKKFAGGEIQFFSEKAIKTIDIADGLLKYQGIFKLTSLGLYNVAKLSVEFGETIFQTVPIETITVINNSGTKPRTIIEPTIRFAFYNIPGAQYLSDPLVIKTYLLNPYKTSGGPSSKAGKGIRNFRAVDVQIGNFINNEPTNG